jgi:hypothetical protein
VLIQVLLGLKASKATKDKAQLAHKVQSEPDSKVRLELESKARRDQQEKACRVLKARLVRLGLILQWQALKVLKELMELDFKVLPDCKAKDCKVMWVRLGLESKVFRVQQEKVCKVPPGLPENAVSKDLREQPDLLGILDPKAHRGKSEIRERSEKLDLKDTWVLRVPDLLAPKVRKDLRVLEFKVRLVLKEQPELDCKVPKELMVLVFRDQSDRQAIRDQLGQLEDSDHKEFRATSEQLGLMVSGASKALLEQPDPLESVVSKAIRATSEIRVFKAKLVKLVKLVRKVLPDLKVRDLLGLKDFKAMLDLLVPMVSAFKDCKELMELDFKARLDCRELKAKERPDCKALLVLACRVLKVKLVQLELILQLLAHRDFKDFKGALARQE